MGSEGGGGKSTKERFRAFGSNRWLVLVCSMWVQSCSGIGYMFGSISPVIKTTMGYNQKQLALLGVAKDLGDSIGVAAGSLIEILPTWVVLLIGAVHNFLGYGLVWLIVTHRLPTLPLWVLCAAIFIGTNGETYFNTADMVSSVQNFPKNRGPVVGILKGFSGLSGAILTQVYAMINAPDQASLIFMVAVGPTMVAIALMFLVRPVEGHKQARESDGSSFLFVYAVCVVLAAYLFGILIVNDVVELSQNMVTLLTVVLLVIVLLPGLIPIKLVFFSEPKPSTVDVDPLLSNEEQQVASSGHPPERLGSFVLSETEDEDNNSEEGSLSTSERNKRMAHLQAKLYQAAAEGAVRVKRRKGPRRGEDFTLMQALVKADFLLIWFSLVLAAGSGLTVIDNLGQICQSLGYNNASIYVSMMSIFNFLGRIAGGYFSEIVVREFAYPRVVAISVVEFTMALGLFYSAMGWPGQIYVLSVVIGLTYGAICAIVPAAVSELFGLKSFGALFNFVNLAAPAGSLVFSGVLASRLYDYYAEAQAARLRLLSSSALLGKQFQQEESLKCMGSVCYSFTFGIMGSLSIVATIVSVVVVRRTKGVYAQLYGKSLA